jgi:uncharacterized protein
LLLAIALFAGLVGAVRAAPPLPGVEDGAGLFKPDTLTRAREQIQEIRDTLHRDVSIETVPAVPPADQKRVHGMGSRELAHYFDKWAKERAAAAGVDGVYILICTDPRHVQVIVWPDSRDATFPARDREKVRKELASQLGKEADMALLHAVAEARATIQARQPVESPATSPAWTVVSVILAIVILWLILGLWRAKLAARDNAMPVGGVSGNAAFLPGLLGGMFGAVAGYWVYDRLFHGGPRVKTESPPAPGETNVASNPTLNGNESAPV